MNKNKKNTCAFLLLCIISPFFAFENKEKTHQPSMITINIIDADFKTSFLSYKKKSETVDGSLTIEQLEKNLCEKWNKPLEVTKAQPFYTGFSSKELDKKTTINQFYKTYSKDALFMAVFKDHFTFEK